MNLSINNIALVIVLMISGLGYGSPKGTKKAKKSRVEKINAPNVEDYATFFSSNESKASKEAQKNADKLRLNTIKSINSLLDSPQLSNIRKFELLLRLGETYVERHDYLRGLEIDEFTKNYDQWEKNGGKGNPPVINNNESRKELTKGANSFRKLVIDFPKHPRTDAALFSLAQTLSRLGNDNAVMYYKQLLRSYPNSKLIPDTHLALGEHYFDRHQINLAIENYKSAMKFKEHKAYPYAIYKLGWAYFNATGRNRKEVKDNLNKSIAAFKLVIKLADLPKYHKGTVSLKDEAIKDLVIVWADAEDVDSAWSYFKEIGEKDMFYNLLERLGTIYAEQGKNENSIKLFTRLLKESPNRETNPIVHANLAELHDLIGNTNQTVTDLKVMQKLYLGNTPWTVANGNKKDKPDLIADTNELVRKTIHRFATTYHKIGQKNKNEGFLRAAVSLYKAYLVSFAQTDVAYEIRFYLAELLHDFKEYQEAATHYMIVSKEKSPHTKYKRESALNAVIAMNTFVNKQKYAKLPKKGHVAKPIPIPSEKSQLVAAIDNFANLMQEDKETSKMRFTAAEIYFDYGHYPQAIKRLASIAKDFPKSVQSSSSIKLIIAYNLDKESWTDTIDWSKKFLAQKEILTDDLEKFLRTSLRTSLFKHGLALEKQNKRLEAAKTFMNFQSEFPDDATADKALYNASLNYYKLGKLDEALAAGNLILEKYKKSDLRADVIASIAQTYESLADFKNAADYYDKLATEFPNDKRSEKSLYNAGVLYRGLRQYDLAEKSFSKILARYKNSPIYHDVLVELADVQEKIGDVKSAVATYMQSSQLLKNKSIEQSYFARAKAASLLALSKEKDKGRKELEKLRAELEKSKTPAYKARQIVASSLFKLYDENDMAEYKNIKLNNGNKIEDQVGRKNKSLMALATKYQGIIALGNGEYSVAALYRMGDLHEELATALFKAPAPQGASQGDIDAFRSQLEKVAFPLREDAYKYFEAAYKRSKEVQTFTVWTKKTYDKMVELKPKDHKKIEIESVAPSYLSHQLYLTDTTKKLAE
ncbi:MAG: tetratricopeptide repeat protein [Bdellovibrionota bacterium]